MEFKYDLKIQTDFQQQFYLLWLSTVKEGTDQKMFHEHTCNLLQIILRLSNKIATFSAK